MDLDPSVSAVSAVSARPMRADARRNCERLVATARVVFTERGEAASLIDIARRAKIGSATLYRHFPNREALLEAVYRDQIAELATAARDLSASTDPLAAVTTWLGAFADHMIRYQAMRGLMAAACSDAESDLASWCRDTLYAAAEDVLGRARAAGLIRRDITSLQVLRLVNAIVLADERTTTRDQIQPLLGLVVDGLRYAASEQVSPRKPAG